MDSQKQINTVTVDLGQLTNTCFVIMPFKPTFDRVYEAVFKQAIRECRLEPKRADEIHGPKRIMSDIWDGLKSSRLVIAELTEKNTNVFYELGLAHALGKPVIIVTSNLDGIPFDLEGIRCIVYEKDHPDWGAQLKESLVNTICSILESDRSLILFDSIRVQAVFPELVEVPQVEVAEEGYNLSGEWELCEQYEYGNTTANLYLTQKGNELSGQVIIVDRPHKGMGFVVQETISGVVEGEKVSLSATNYQVIQGNILEYQLDQWVGTIQDENTIRGESRDLRGVTGQFVLKRRSSGSD